MATTPLNTNLQPPVRDIRQQGGNTLADAMTKKETDPRQNAAATLDVEEIKRKREQEKAVLESAAAEINSEINSTDGSHVEAVVLKTDTAKDEKIVWLAEENRRKDMRIKDLEGQVENLNNVLNVSRSKEVTPEILEMLREASLSNRNSKDEYLQVVPTDNHTCTVGYREVPGSFEKDGSPKKVPNQVTLLKGRPLRLHRDVVEVVKSHLVGFS